MRIDQSFPKIPVEMVEVLVGWATALSAMASSRAVVVDRAVSTASEGVVPERS